MQNIFTVMLMIFLFLGVSCRTTVDFPSSSELPAAEISAKVKQGKNDNYKIKLEAEHLAEPDRLQPSRDVYVVWLDTDENGSKNIGRLIPENNKKASIETTSAYKPIRIFITAENEANIDYPRGEVVFESKRIN